MNPLPNPLRALRAFVSMGWTSGTAWAAVLAAICLAACGVGGEGTGGTGSAHVSSGRIEGFGSVVVAGERLDDAGAEVFEVIDPRSPTPRPLSDLRLGQQVTVAADGGRARRLTLAPVLVGTLDVVDAVARQLVVAGQTVVLDSAPAEPTVLEGLGTLTGLEPGTPLVVHGQRAADGRIHASHVQRREVLPGVRVHGRVDAVDDTLGTVRIGALTVDVRAAQRQPAGYAPRVGDLVVVYGPVAAAATTWPAAVMDARPALEASEGAVRLRGLLDRWDPAAATGTVAGALLDLSGLPAAERASLLSGDLLLVRGRAAGGRIVAEQVQRLDPGQALRAEVDARVGGLVDGRRFVLRGVAVDASLARFEALLDRNVARGVPLRVNGVVTADGIRADAVAPGGVAPGDVVVQAGVVESWDPVSRLIRLQGLSAPARLAGDANLVGGDLGLLVPGRAVAMRGRIQGSEFVASHLDLTDPQAQVELSGLAGNVEAGFGGSGEFEIGPVDMVWTATTRFLGTTGTPADLVDGRFIRVIGVRGGAVVVATEVDARTTIPGTVRLRGTVTDFNGLSDFRIDGQRVDASSAVFEPTGLRAALAGAEVEIEGSLSGGVLRASLVRDP